MRCGRPVDRERAGQLAMSWIEAWNRHDLDAVMGHYAAGVVFQAPTVVRRWARPDGILRGDTVLREHFRRGLELAPASTSKTCCSGPAATRW